MICPKCNRGVRPVETKFGPRWVCCGLHSWSSSRPMVDAETLAARQKAHRAFDTLWKTGRMRRRAAYKLLAEFMGMAEADCHMALMDKETARRVPKVVRKIICKLRKENRYKTGNKQSAQ